jgi:uncharacterized membrane protein
MLPNPLHPAVVHFPIVLAVLVPAVAVLGALAIARRRLPARSWAAVVLLQGLLVGASWLAIETGENEEERVEDVVRESRSEAHEEAAERFLSFAVAAWVVSAAGLLRGRFGGVGRIATVAATAGVLAAGVAVGHSGGELVYRYGAASAYVDEARAESRATADVAGTPRVARRTRHDDDD